MSKTNHKIRTINPVQEIGMHSKCMASDSIQIKPMENLYKNIRWMFVCFLMGINISSFAQQSKNAAPVVYSGVVKDMQNIGIQGVTVSVQEANISVLTDVSGRFSITTNSDGVLNFKKTGYLSKSHKLGLNTSIELTLEPAKLFAGDDDYIEIPSGIRQKRYLTGAVSSIKAAELPQPSTSSLTNVLSGRLAGFNVVQQNTQPGNDESVYRVRGNNSFGFSNALVIIDGVQRELSDIDFDEVESFTVLKDPATLSWYGLRGAKTYGVLMVTTKKGSSSRSIVNFNAQYGVQTPDHMLDQLNSFEFASLYNEALLNDNPTAAPRYDQTALNAYQNGSNPFLYPDNNYQERFVRSSTPYERYVTSVQGGDNSVRYFALMGYMNQDGLFNEGDGVNYNSNNNYKRYNFRGNVDFDVNPMLTVSANIAGRVENRRDPGIGTTALMGLINNTRPNAYPILNQDGTFGATVEDQNNILGSLTANGILQNKQRVGYTNLNARHKLDMLIKGLSVNILAAYDTKGDYASGFTENYRAFDATGTGSPLPFRTEAHLAYRSAAYANAYRHGEAWLGFDYDRTFNKHKVNASIRGMRSETIDYTSRTDFSQRIQGISSRVDYSFDQKYLLSFVSSYSGDDDLPPNNRYGFFPAVSAGWIISDENLFSNSNVVSFLKLRASYGQTGNTQLGLGLSNLGRFPYRSKYTRSLTSGGYQFGTGFAASGSAAESTIGNPFITWETVTTTNLGLDFSLFRNTLSATVDVFKNRREDILTSAAVPDVIGQVVGDLNEGIVDSKGFEGFLGYNKSFRDFKLALNANFLVSDNKIVYQGGQLGIPAYQSSIGQSSESELYYVSNGIYQTAGEIAAGPVSTLSNQILPGDIRYKDIDNNKKIDANDRVRYPFKSPAYYGLGALFTYKMFDLNLQFQGTFGQEINIRSIVDAGPSSFNRESLKRWTPATAATALYPRVGIANLGNNRANSDFWVRDADYLKLKTVELGVNLPSTLARKLKMESLRLYFNGFNVFTFSQLDLDVDPELPFLGRGSTYPYIKTYSFGLNAKF